MSEIIHPTTEPSRNRAPVADILNPVESQPKFTIEVKPPETPKQTPVPGTDTVISISSSSIASSKSTPTSVPTVSAPVKPPLSIRLHVPLHGATNVYINFASLAEKTYGPGIFNSKRLAPQGFASSFLNHDRILEGSESEAEDSDEDTEAETDRKTPKKRKRAQVVDRYDVEDPFIDDSEALMEQVAAASKDGFFVYSGPLIAEGERAKIDK
jgi:HPC2 and ubinuclein domain